MEGYEVLSMEKHGQALTARVRFSRADGQMKEATYSWPAKITRSEIEKILTIFWQEFLAEPTQPVVLHEAMDLVGRPQDLGPPGPGKQP